jgi:hypothetical protein
MGKARASRQRRRGTEDFHQLLIEDYLSEEAAESRPAPTVRVRHSGQETPAVPAGPMRGVRVVSEPARSEGVSVSRLVPVVRPSRSGPGLAASPAVERQRRRFRWGALVTGFLMSFVPGVCLLLILSAFLR